jgi:hypothetical protein
MNNTINWIEEYADIIDTARTRLTTVVVLEEQTLKYAVVRLFSRTVLAMCEIYTLINNKYPNGAFALTRQVYESIVIMS